MQSLDVENSQLQNLSALSAFILDAEITSRGVGRTHQMCEDAAALLMTGEPARVLCAHSAMCSKLRAKILAIAGDERDELLTVSSKAPDLVGRSGIVFEGHHSQAHRVSDAIMGLVIV